MNQQLAITFPADWLGKQTHQRKLEALRLAVKHLTAKEVAFVLDVGVTQLSDALHERAGKHWYDEWTCVVKAMLAGRHGDEPAQAILHTLLECDVDGMPVALVEAEPLTAEEEAAALRRELSKFGDAGKQAIERISKRRGRR